MQEIKNLVQISSQKALNTYSEPAMRRLLPHEQAVIRVKNQSRRVQFLNDEEIDTACRGLVVKICVITGWPLPQATMLEILIQQFGLLLREKYPNVNPDEIEYAIRNYPRPNYGKSLNLGDIADSLDDYLSVRVQVSTVEESAVKSLKIENRPIETDEEKKQYVEKCFETGYETAYLVPEFLFDDAVNLGIISVTKEDKISLFERAKIMEEKRLKNILDFKDQFSDSEYHNAASEITYIRTIDHTKKDNPLFTRIAALAKKISVLDCILKNKI